MSIFGTGFGQSNQQQQQQQPQQPQQNAFGQPSAFGGTGFGAFGGQNNQQQQQQPQANPMFGNLATPTANPSGGFGAFGGATSAFGQAKPAFGQPSGGTGAFGNTQQPSAFGNASGSGAFGNTGTGGGAFSASGSGTGAFGQPVTQQQQQQQPGGFGSGGGLFGKPAGPGFAGGNALAPALPTAGSSNPSYQDFQERDSTGPGSVSTMLHYQSISCMPAYRNASFEELRVQDYQQGRKTANAFGGAAPNAFGQPAQQQQQPAAGGLFGQPATTGAFGQQQPQQPGGFGTFGQQQQQQPQQGAFGAFGQTQQQQQQQPATGGFSAFGQPQQNQQQPAGAFGTFGQQQPQQQSTGLGAFGQQNQQNKGFGVFGQAQPAAPGFSAFGPNPSTNTGPSLFGQPQQPQQQQQNTSAFGAFGQQNQQQSSLLKPSVFGTPTAVTGGGLFGNTQQQQGTGGGAFGQQPAQPQQSGGLFGQQPGGTGAFGQPTQPGQQSNVFGQPSSTGGGLFGNVNQQQQNQQQQQQQQPQQPGSAFGSLFSKPAGGGLFGSTPQQNQSQQQQNPNPANPLFAGGGGLFGNTQQQQGQQQNTNPLFGGASGGSLFGGKPPAPSSGFGSGGGLFGNMNSQQQQQPSLGGGIFGNTNSQQQQPQSSFFGNASQQQQPNLTASIDQPLPPTSTTLPPLPSLAASLSPSKKKSNVFADVAARASPRLGLGIGLGSNGMNYVPPGPGSKLRGFGGSTSTTAAVVKNPFTLPLSPGTAGSLLSPDAFSGGGTNGMLGGARQSVKKLVLEKRVDEDELHRMRPGTSSPAPKPREVRFSPGLGVQAREREREREHEPAPSPARPRPASRLNDVSNVSPPPHPAKDAHNAPLDPKEGEYWSLPPVAELQRLSFGELQVVRDFTVGRVGFGTIQFLQPVDLTAVPSIADIPGKVVTFEHVECMLYPDERLKPPPGEGLNVPARIKLDQCWVMDKSTREPIKDEKDPKHQQRMRKMRAHEGAEFVSFDMETGVWEFTVQEF